jgi:hypothetical protein
MSAVSDIFQLLLLLQTKNPQWVLPSSCFNTTQRLNGQDEADVGDWMEPCKAESASALELNAECASITKQQPLYTCSFESLSSFYQIKQAIRDHGAVVPRYARNSGLTPCRTRHTMYQRYVQ